MATLARLEELRAEGNALFSAKDLTRAVEKYSEGLEIADAIANDSEKGGEEAVDDKTLDEQRVLLWNNRAACWLQLQQFARAQEDCSRALAVDSGNAKARYRRAQAHVGLGHLTDAFQDVRLVLQLTPGNKAAVALARKIKEAVQDDANGVQKALDTLASCAAELANASAKRLAEDQGNKKLVEDALVFLEMKSHAELTSVPAEIARRGGLAVIWRLAVQLLTCLEEDKHSTAQDVVLSIVAHAVAVLSVVASASVELAGRVFEESLTNGGNRDDAGANSSPSGFDRVIQVFHAQIALEYKEPDAEAPHPGGMALRGRKAIVKLCAFTFKYLMVSSASSTSASVSEAHVRSVFNGLLYGLRSREVELQIATLDGLLHFISVTSAALSSTTIGQAQLDDETRRRLSSHFSTLTQELGVFPLLHATAAGALHVSTDTASIHIVLSRLPLVFTQCLAQLEGKDSVLRRLVTDFCVTPVLEVRTTDRSLVEAASSSCLLLSALFLSNAKLALWAVQQTTTVQDEEGTAGGTAFMSRINKLLDASRTWASNMNYSGDHTRRLQEIWVDCVASVCGVENGAQLVPPILRVEMYKMLRAALDDDDLALRASALSIQVKIAIVEKTLELETVDGQFLVDTMFDVLESAHAKETKQREAATAVAKGKKPTPEQKEAAAFATWSTRTSPKERAIEALSYLITQTDVKEAFVKRPNAVKSVFAVEFPSTSASTMHVGYRSNVYYGIGYILHHTLTSESALKKKQMEGMELTPEQYEELQKALKQKSVLEDGDSPELVHARVQKLAASRDVLTTLVQLLKFATTSSQNVLEMAVLSALHASEVPQVRGSLVQCGVFQALIPLSIHTVKKPASKSSDPKAPPQQQGTTISNAAGQAMARILISTNPNLIPSSSLLSSVKPLLQLCKGETQLLQFEALMALTNVASVSDETKSRIVAEPQGLSTLQYLQFSEHELVRRAATEAICNLLPNDEVIDKVFLNEERLRLWIALSSVEEEEEDFETARAASGALAMVSQVPAVAWLMLKQGGLATFSSVVESSTQEETLHRALFAVENMAGTLTGTLATTGSSEDEVEKRKEAAKFVDELKTHRNTLTMKVETLIARGSPAVQEAARSCLAAIAEVK